MEGKWRVRPRALSQLGDHPLSNRRNAGSPSRRTACRLPTYTRGQMLPPSRKLDIRGRNAGRRDLMNLLHPKQARYQASLQPEPQEQRLDSSTRGSATFRDSRASRLAGPSGGPPVTKPLPAPYKLADKPAGSGRQTLLEYVLITPVPCSKPVAIRDRAPGFVYAIDCSMMMTIGATPASLPGQTVRRRSS